MIKYFNKMVEGLGATVLNFDIIPSAYKNEITGNNVFFIGWKATMCFKGKNTQHGRYWPCIKDYQKDGLDKEVISLIKEDFAYTITPVIFED